jgi:hypothetical protein
MHLRISPCLVMVALIRGTAELYYSSRPLVNSLFQIQALRGESDLLTGRCTLQCKLDLTVIHPVECLALYP